VLRPPALSRDTHKYVNTDRYVNTTEYLHTLWYHQAMKERLSRQDRKSQTRERLIDAAAEVFARRGFEAATLDEVAAAAGYTKGAVYSNFTSKLDLFVALTERRIEVQTRVAARRLDQAGSEARSAADGPLAIDADAERPWVMLVFEVWLQAMRDPLIRDVLAEQYRRARTISASMIAAAYERAGEVAPLPAREMAIVVEALGIGIAFQGLLDPEEVKASLHAAALARLLRLPAFDEPAAAPEPAASER
jgi:AcrR family transcriptional regulator